MYFPNTTAMDGGGLWGEWPAENGQACVLFLGNTSNCHSWRQNTGWDGPLVWHSRAFLMLLELCMNVSVPFNIELSSFFICVSLNLLYLSQQINASLIICLHLLECRLLSFKLTHLLTVMGEVLYIVCELIALEIWMLNIWDSQTKSCFVTSRMS